MDFQGGVGLNAKCHVLLYRGQEHPFKIISVPEPPKEAVTTVIYAQEHY